MLTISNVTRCYGDFVAVDKLNLVVPAGSIFGFLGPNGAGKTTTMKMVCGLIRPSSGQITVGGLDVVKNPLAVKKQIGYVPDRPHLYERLTAREYMYFIAGLYSIESSRGKTRTDELLELFGLSRVRDHLVESFSHGMKQRLVMASVLLHEPKLMVVDEPMVGLDPQGARLLKDVLREEVQGRGLTVLLSTHTLDVADEVCDQVAVINHGRLVAKGTTAELRSQTGTEGKHLEEVFLQLTTEGDPRAAQQ
jgi:ABC-2 type transport system ATP-binding protein